MHGKSSTVKKKKEIPAGKESSSHTATTRKKKMWKGGVRDPKTKVGKPSGCPRTWGGGGLKKKDKRK